MDFLKGFIIPSKMRRFRNMSGLIALGIFFVLMYIAVIPIRVRYSRPDYVISKNGYESKAFYEANTDYDYSQIKSKNYIIDTTNLVLTAGVKTTSTYVINATAGEKNVTFNVVFDLEKETYDQNEDLFDTYGIDKNDDNYLLLFSLNYYELQNITTVTVDEADTKKGTIVSAATYKGCPIDFGAYNNAEEFLDGIANALASLYGEVYTSSFTFTSMLMLFILPLLLIIVMWLILRKNGSMKKFKEYYNIAAICSVVPSLVAFGIAWFWPQIINFYTTVFVVYYLFCVWRINGMPDEEVKKAPVKKPQPAPMAVEAEVIKEPVNEEAPKEDKPLEDNNNQENN